MRTAPGLSRRLHADRIPRCAREGCAPLQGARQQYGGHRHALDRRAHRIGRGHLSGVSRMNEPVSTVTAQMRAPWTKVQRELAAMVKPLIRKQFNGFDRSLAFRDRLRGECMSNENV